MPKPLQFIQTQMWTIPSQAQSGPVRREPGYSGTAGVSPRIKLAIYPPNLNGLLAPQNGVVRQGVLIQ